MLEKGLFLFPFQTVFSSFNSIDISGSHIDVLERIPAARRIYVN